MTERGFSFPLFEFRTLAASCGWNDKALWDRFLHGLAEHIKDEISYRLENQLCLYCGEAGHVAASCPAARRRSPLKGTRWASLVLNYTLVVVVSSKPCYCLKGMFIRLGLWLTRERRAISWILGWPHAWDFHLWFWLSLYWLELFAALFSPGLLTPLSLSHPHFLAIMLRRFVSSIYPPHLWFGTYLAG